MPLPRPTGADDDAAEDVDNADDADADADADSADVAGEDDDADDGDADADGREAAASFDALCDASAAVVNAALRCSKKSAGAHTIARTACRSTKVPP